jgi:hypothetical protein
LLLRYLQNAQQNTGMLECYKDTIWPVYEGHCCAVASLADRQLGVIQKQVKQRQKR